MVCLLKDVQVQLKVRRTLSSVGTSSSNTDGDNGDHGACAAARGNASDGDPLGNDDATTAAIAGEADDAGQENGDRGGDDGDDDEKDDKWGRGA